MGAPYRKLDDFEYEYRLDNRRERPSLEILALFMQDMMNEEKGKVAPDTTGHIISF